MTDNTGFSGLFSPQFLDESPGRVHCFHTRLFPGGSAGGSDFFPSPRVADTVNSPFCAIPLPNFFRFLTTRFTVVILVLQR